MAFTAGSSSASLQEECAFSVPLPNGVDQGELSDYHLQVEIDNQDLKACSPLRLVTLLVKN